MKTLILLNCNIAIFVQLRNYLEIAQFFAEADVLVIILEMEKRTTFVYSKKSFYVKIISCTKRNWYRNSSVHCPVCKLMSVRLLSFYVGCEYQLHFGLKRKLL